MIVAWSDLISCTKYIAKNHKMKPAITLLKIISEFSIDFLLLVFALGLSGRSPRARTVQKASEGGGGWVDW